MHSNGRVPNRATLRYQGEVRHYEPGAFAAPPPFPGSGRAHRRAAAFADGRIARDAARARRGMPRRRRHPGLLPVALVLLAALILGVGDELFVGVLVVGGASIALMVLVAMAAPTLTVGTIAFVVVRHTRRRSALRRGGAAGTAPLPARPAAPPRPEAVWAHARQSFHGLRAAYAAYECDAMQVLRLPALADVSVPSTARFIDAFAEAQALETDALPPHAPAFVAAVDRAERAWRAAHDAAERIRLSGLSPAERGTVEKVIKLLTTARDSDSDAERLAAYTFARAELAKLDRAGVVHVPLPAQAALDAASRGALPA